MSCGPVRLVSPTGLARNPHGYWVLVPLVQLGIKKHPKMRPSSQQGWTPKTCQTGQKGLECSNHGGF